jgi:hypothetical protein
MYLNYSNASPRKQPAPQHPTAEQPLHANTDLRSPTSTSILSPSRSQRQTAMYHETNDRTAISQDDVVLHSGELDVERTHASKDVYHASYFPQSAIAKPVKRHQAKAVRPPAYHYAKRFSTQSNLPRKYVLIAMLLVSLLNVFLIGFSLNDTRWSESYFVDEGQSGVVVWSEEHEYAYYLTEYDDLKGDEGWVSYDALPRDDFRSGCELSGERATGLSSMALIFGLATAGLSLVHLLFNDDSQWDTKHRVFAIGILASSFMVIFFLVFSLGVWWFQCHFALIKYERNIQWDTDVTRIEGYTRASTGFWLNFAASMLSVATLSFYSAYYKRAG